MPDTHTDCRTDTGVTVGLVDAIITTCRVLADRDLTDPAVQAALDDAHADTQVQQLLASRDPDTERDTRLLAAANGVDLDDPNISLAVIGHWRGLAKHARMQLDIYRMKAAANAR